jgi:hypothetical protein
MHNPQLKQWLHQIDVPTLVLRGAEDQIVAKHNHEAYLVDFYHHVGGFGHLLAMIQGGNLSHANKRG